MQRIDYTYITFSTFWNMVGLLQERILYTIERTAQRCRLQNKDSTEEPTFYRGTEDGRIAQGMMDAMHLLRVLNLEKVQELDKKMRENPWV